jgi:hypothetical protein
MTESHSYQHPVSQILHLKEATSWEDDWLDYTEMLGLTTADIPELIRLSWDQEPLDFEVEEWGVHAIRAVIQLDSEVGLNLYIDQLKKFPDDDWLHEEVSGISKRVGAIAIKPFVELLKDPSQELWLRSTAANGLQEVAKAYPECRDACVQATIAQLHHYQQQDDGVINSILVDTLIQLKAVEAASLIEQVFANCEIDEWLTGSWASAQVKLGLKQESDFSPEDLKPKPPEKILAIREMLDAFEKNRNVNDWNQRSLMPTKPVAKGFGLSKQGKQSNKNKKKKR